MPAVTLPAPHDVLLPLPRRLELRPGALALAAPLALRPPPGFASPALEGLRQALAAHGAASARAPAGARGIELVLDGRSGHPREGYGLVIEPGGARLVASRGVGLNHGLRTLTQLLRAAAPGSALPALEVVDAPAFERRGVMLDVSRDRVPRLEELFALVERLAEWKLNELQLYFEHAFAYAGHERVWRGVDPFTADELRALDRHCAAHGIELVPNQQSFGHLHHWLKHPEYRHLAEVPDGILHPFLGAGVTTPEPFSLCPTDPRSLTFLGGLYDQLLPCFTSNAVNVGLDETIDLGPGRSAAVLRARGVGRVYLDFLRSVHGLVDARGKRMQFWADILLNHAELVPEVPKDALACLWGYEADHPFEAQTETLAAAGLDFVVCPGTSSWQSLGGRLDNMLANVHAAARSGAARGAKGLLVTDWGDRGHLQPSCASWPGFLVAAEVAWHPNARLETRAALQGQLARELGHGDLARDLLELGSLPACFRVPLRNASALSVLLTRFDAPFPPADLAGLTSGALREAGGRARAVGARPAGAPAAAAAPRALDATALAEREVRWVAAVLAFSSELGLARLEAGEAPLEALPAARRERLTQELAPLVAEHRRLWLERSRPGGLERSARWLERVLAALRARG